MTKQLAGVYDSLGQAGAPDASIAFADLSEVGKFERMDRLVYDLNKIQQRWDDRLVLENCSLGEEYIAGRLSVVCYLHPACISDSMNLTARTDAERGVGPRVSALVYHVNSGKAGDCKHGDEELVFVDVVDSAERHQSIVSTVGLYIVQDGFSDMGAGALYASKLFGGYKFLPRFLHREVDAIITSANDRASNVVQRAAKAMGGIPDKKGENKWRFGARDHLKQVAAGIRIRLNDNLAWAGVDERLQGCMQISDVLVGPLDL